MGSFRDLLKCLLLEAGRPILLLAIGLGLLVPCRSEERVSAPGRWSTAYACMGRELAVQIGRVLGKDINAWVARPAIYEDGTIATPIFYGNGELGAIKVSRPGQGAVTFERTNRRLSEYSIPTRFFQGFRGRKVADVGMGGGRAVIELRRMGVDAYGLDILLTEEQKTRPYFHQCDTLHTGRPDGEFDAVIMNLSVFSYHATRKGESSYQYGLDIMKELVRITRLGGKIILGEVQIRDIQDLVKELDGVAIVDHSRSSGERWVVLTKTGR
jgi:SAM-dependent methyltransferase